MLKVASSTPPTTARSTGVCAWPSIENVTVPVGVPVPEPGATIAVNVTFWPIFAGFDEDERLVVVAVAAAIDGVSTTSSPLLPPV